jgi:hypothetical protein
MELFFNRLSMISLIVAGLVFLYQGIHYFKMKKDNPSLPSKMYLVCVVAIIVGLADIGFGIAHFWL